LGFGIWDFANYRRPDVQIFFVTNTTFISDGSFSQYFANAYALVQSSTPREDLAAMVEHYAFGE